VSQEHRSAGQINMLYHIKIDKYLYRHIQVVNLESAIFWDNITNTLSHFSDCFWSLQPLYWHGAWV